MLRIAIHPVRTLARRAGRRAAFRGLVWMQLVCIAGWMATSIGHAAAHEHRYCAQHDAFEESGGNQAGAQAETPRTDGDGAQRLARAGARIGSEHEACGFLLALRQSGTTPAAAASVAPPPPLARCHGPFVATQTDALRGAVYLIAPKQSPPR